jgi:integral membrane protein (TIGR01906 family)
VDVGAFRTLASILFVTCIPVALLTTTVRFVANEPRVYRYAVDEYGAVVSTGIARDQLIRAGADLRAYFNNGQDEPVIRVTRGDQEINLFNARESTHLKDVKQRFRTMNRVQEFSVLYLIAYVAAVVLWAREVTPRRLALNVIFGCIASIATVGVAGALGASGFDSAWEGFHKVLFSNDFWRLNPDTDRLIQIYPPEFWQNIVFFIGLLVVAEAALLIIAAALYLGASRHAEARRLEPYYA